MFMEVYLFQWLADISTDMRSTSPDGKDLMPRWNKQPIDSIVFYRLGHYWSEFSFMKDLAFLQSDFWASVLEVEEDEAEAEAAARAACALMESDAMPALAQPMSPKLPKGFIPHAKILAKMLQRVPPERCVSSDEDGGDNVGNALAQPRAACYKNLRDFERLQLEMVCLREAQLDQLGLVGAARGGIDPALTAQLSMLAQSALQIHEDVKAGFAEQQRFESRMTKKLDNVIESVGCLKATLALGQGVTDPEELVAAGVTALLNEARAGTPGAMEKLLRVRDGVLDAVATIDQPQAPPPLLIEGPAAGASAMATQGAVVPAVAAASPPTFKAFQQYFNVKALVDDWEAIAAPRDRDDPAGKWRHTPDVASPQVKAAWDNFRKEYSKRAKIIAAIAGKMENSSASPSAAIAAVEAMRTSASGAHLTVYQLYKALTQESVR